MPMAEQMPSPLDYPQIARGWHEEAAAWHGPVWPQAMPQAMPQWMAGDPWQQYHADMAHVAWQ
jgi:hypothetical protein